MTSTSQMLFLLAIQINKYQVSLTDPCDCIVL